MSTACQHGHYPVCLCAYHRVLHELSAEMYTHERGPPTAEATAAIKSLSSSYEERREIVKRLEESADGPELCGKACRDATSHLWFEQDDTGWTDSSESSGPEANALSPGIEEDESASAQRVARDIVARSLRRPEPTYIIEIEEIEDVEDVDAEGEADAEGEPDDEVVIYEFRDASVYEAAPVDAAHDADSDDQVQDTLSADTSSFNTISADRISFNTLSELLRRGQGERPRRNSGALEPQSAGSWRVEVANAHGDSADSMLETEEEP